MKNPMKTEPVITLATAQLGGNAALHPILEGVGMGPLGHTLLHGLVSTGLFVAARQSVFAPASVDKIKAEAGAAPVK